MQYRGMTVAIVFEEDDFYQLNSIFEYLYSMYRNIYRRQ